MQVKLCPSSSATSTIQRRLTGIAVSAALVVLSSFAASAQAPALTKIRIAGQDAQVGATPIFAAINQGYFKDAGLDVSFVVMGGGATPMAAALKTGELEMSVGGASQFMEYVARGLVPGKIIGEITDNLNTIFGGNGITDIRQLRGKVFGISSFNAGDHILSMAVLKHFGIQPDEVTWVPVGVPVSRLAALVSGKIDAMETSVTSLPESARSRIILGGDEIPVPFVSASIFVRQGFIDANRPALTRFLAAVGKGSDWVRAHPDEALKPCVDGAGAKIDVCKSSIDYLITTKNPYTLSSTTKINMEAIKGMIAVLAADLPQAKNMTAEEFADPTLAAAR